MYANGEGVPQDKVRAVEFFTKAAEQGITLAQCTLGYMYECGEGVPQDVARAVELFTKAAVQGDSSAQCTLGLMYEYGKGVLQDVARAVELFTKAAEQGNEVAQHTLGCMYKYGKGVLQDKARAVELFTQAAAQGDSSAQFMLGVMYAKAQGVRKDLPRAGELLAQAAAQAAAKGNASLQEKAEKHLVRISPRIAAAESSVGAESDLGEPADLEAFNDRDDDVEEIVYYRVISSLRGLETAWRVPSKAQIAEAEHERTWRRKADREAQAAEARLTEHIQADAKCRLHTQIPHILKAPRSTAATLWPTSAPLSSEIQLLLNLWDEGGRRRQQATPSHCLGGRYTLTRIEAVEISSAESTFVKALHDLEGLRASGLPQFNPTFPDTGGEKAILRARLDARSGPIRENIMLAFHGCSHDGADSLCRNGFAQVNYRDNGWFGKGLYTTTYAEYACSFSTGECKSAYNSPNASDEHVVLGCWVMLGNCYPISRAEDYKRSSSTSSQYHARQGPAKSLRNQFQSHYVCIRSSDYQCANDVRGAEPDYDELVVLESKQLLPAYRFYFRLT